MAQQPGEGELQQVRANVAAADWHLSPADLAEVDKLTQAAAVSR
jgi:aryl-alcohol dehydrogenase-like predicted oxidoreductase